MRLFCRICLGCFACLFSVALFAQTESSDSLSSSIFPSEKQFFQTVMAGNNRFAFDFYHRVKNKPGNLCFSSHSIVAGLAMVAMGTKGETAHQFQHALHYSLSLLPLIGDFNALLQSSVDTKNISRVWLANALWVQNDLTFFPSFTLALQRGFNSSLQFLNFEKESSRSILQINKWTSQKTDNKINSLVSGREVNSKTRFLLTTAFYMQGPWENPFDPRQTKRLSFRLSPQRSFLADMMHATSQYLLWKGDKWDLLVLPYAQGQSELQLALAIILPKEGEIEEVEKDLSWESWQNGLSQLEMQAVSLTLPRFRIEDRFDLNAELESLGIKLPFNSEADFSGMTKKKGLFLNEAVHKISFRIDERGSEMISYSAKAAKSTPEPIGGQAPYEFLADRPFIFVVWDQKSDLILLMGRLSLP